MLLPAVVVSVLLSISASLPAGNVAGWDGSPSVAAAPARPQQPQVWTNDSFEQLPAEDAVAEVAPDSADSQPVEVPPVAEVTYNPLQDPERYRELLAPLEAQLASIAEQAAQIRAALDDPLRYGTGAFPFGDAALGRPRLSPENELQLLEARRLAVEAQMAEIRTQARQNWLAPGVVR